MTSVARTSDPSAASSQPRLSLSDAEATHKAELDSILSQCATLAASSDRIVIADMMGLSARVSQLLGDIQSAHWLLHLQGDSNIYSELWCQKIEEAILNAMYESTVKLNVMFLSNNHHNYWTAAKRIRQVYKLVFGSYRYSGCVTFNEVYAGALSAALVAAMGSQDIPTYFKRAASDVMNILRKTHSLDVENLHALFSTIDASLFSRHKDDMMKSILRTGPRPEKPSAPIPTQYITISSELRYEHTLICAAEGNYENTFDRLRPLKVLWLGEKTREFLSDPTVGMPKFVQTLVPEQLAELCMCFEYDPEAIEQELASALKAHKFGGSQVSNDIVNELRVWFEKLTETVTVVTSSSQVTRRVAAALLQGCHDGVKGAVLANFGDSFSTFLATQMGAFIKSKNASHFQTYAKLLVFLPNLERFTDEYERRLVDRLMLHPVMHLTAEKKGVDEIVQYLGHYSMCRSEALLRLAAKSRHTDPSDPVKAIKSTLFALPGLLVPDSTLPAADAKGILAHSAIGVSATSLCNKDKTGAERKIDCTLSTAEVEVTFTTKDGVTGSSSIFGSLPQLAVVMALDPKAPTPIHEEGLASALQMQTDVLIAIFKSLGGLLLRAPDGLVSLNIDHLAANRKIILPRLFR